MKRPALFVASVLLLGCGTPFQLLVHNDLGADREITIRWSQTYNGKTEKQEEIVLVPKGKAESALLWYGPSDEEDVVFEWQGERGKRKLRIPSSRFTSQTYHAYVGNDAVRLAPRDTMDALHENLVGYNAPMVWGIVLLFGLPTAIHLLLSRRKAAK